MKIKIKALFSQVCRKSFLVFSVLPASALLTLTACNLKKTEAPVLPPISSPLSQDYIGFGVINVSYTRVTENPDADSFSPGYLRLGTVVRVLERKSVKTGDKTDVWLLVEENCTGWLRESLVNVYDNESQAQTASVAISK